MRVLVNNEQELHSVRVDPEPSFISRLGDRSTGEFTIFLKDEEGLRGPGFSRIDSISNSEIEILEDGTILIKDEEDKNRFPQYKDVILVESSDWTYRTIANLIDGLVKYISFDNVEGEINPILFEIGAVPYGFAGLARVTGSDPLHSFNVKPLQESWSIGGWVKIGYVDNCFIFSNDDDSFHIRIYNTPVLKESILLNEDGSLFENEDGQIEIGGTSDMYNVEIKYPGGMLSSSNLNLSEWTYLVFVRSNTHASLFVNGDRVVYEQLVSTFISSSTIRIAHRVSGENEAILNSFLLDEWAIWREEVDPKALFLF